MPPTGNAPDFRGTRPTVISSSKTKMLGPAASAGLDFGSAPISVGQSTPHRRLNHSMTILALDSPPAPWIDLGWIDNFQRVSLTPSEPLRAGIRGAAAAQFRGILDARIEFDFREWGKLQMALAGGSEHMNVLATD